MNLRLLIVVTVCLSALLPLASAAHFITGQVQDALDGTGADGRTIVVWNPAVGVADNVTDTIGPSGISGAENTYLVDCELLSNGCSVGDELRAKVFNEGDDYITNFANLTVTGAGFDSMPELTLNSPPSVVLQGPMDGGNLSQNPVSFFCNATDLDSNLVNITLYGNWSDGWHANATVPASGDEAQANYNITLQEGLYEWNCRATDNLSISSYADQNYSFTLDLTGPNIDSIALNRTGSICGISEVVRVNCTVTDDVTEVESVWIQSSIPNSTFVNDTASFLAGDTYFIDKGLEVIGDWGFTCYANDSAGNLASLPSPDEITVYSNEPDLNLMSEDIVFDPEDPIENALVSINATVFNNGCSNTTSASVGFFDGDPDSGGSQINGNQSADILGLGNTTFNITWPAEIGPHNIYVLSDINQTYTESNETNNDANKTLNVTAWQVIYGNATLDKILADQNISNFTLWQNESSLSGNIFVADSEAEIDWTSLQAMGRNQSGSQTGNDFGDIDSLLGMESYPDSVSSTYTTDGNTPKSTRTYLVHQRLVQNVPVINSTSFSEFVTGVLWDTSDDIGDGEYSQDDQEDLIFAGILNKSKTGQYGTYDYELRYPVRLRDYDESETTEVFIYFDLN